MAGGGHSDGVAVPGQLERLAAAYGVELEYVDGCGRRRRPSLEASLALFRALGAPIARVEDIPAALAARVHELWSRAIDPVIVAWEGRVPPLVLRLPSVLENGRAEVTLQWETGECHRWTVNLEHRPALGSRSFGRSTYVIKAVPLRIRCPWGYHTLSVECGDRCWRAEIIAAPIRAAAAGDGERRTEWGVFLPLYALHSRRSWGVGDLSDLARLAGWAGAWGAGIVGTLPLLPTFLDELYDPSPYAPISRMFWNEVYLDVTAVPEVFSSAAACALMVSPELVRELSGVRRSGQVDYRRVMALKRQVVEAAARDFFRGNARAVDPSRRAAFEAFCAAHPLLEDYARFRATCEVRRKPWWQWPSPEREGRVSVRDEIASRVRYHRFVQWLMHEQMARSQRRAAAAGVRLYLDLPVGVNRAGYDVWRQRALFMLGARAGAPPDGFFPGGQDWGFPPLHPARIRDEGYRYFRDVLRHHMGSAGVLRIDHVFGLHRIFSIPEGFSPLDGAYVRYPAEELYAVLVLESRRHGTVLVGEDLGTAPPEVRPAMARHGLYPMSVFQFEAGARPGSALPAIPRRALACLNTHDTATFAGFWRAKDVADRRAMGLIGPEEAVRQTRHRAQHRLAIAADLRRAGWLSGRPINARNVARAVAAYLVAAGPELVLLNLEDLWGEEAPQNVPGTGQERPNWQRKARFSLEWIERLPSVAEAFRLLQRAAAGVPRARSK